MEQNRHVDLSIILDTETLKITRELFLDGRVALWEEAARRITPRSYEIILCSEHEMAPGVTLPEGWRVCIDADGGYYGLKTVGGKTATGTILFWSDLDCRPEPDYFENLLRHFSETDCQVIGGRTFYDQTGFVARMNSAISWGFLHGVDQLGPSDNYMAHNVACRKAAAGNYFGPYTGRYGGDEYITSQFREKGEAIRVFQDLIIYHESASRSLRALLDRHLREIGRLALINSTTGIVTGADFKLQAQRQESLKWYLFQQHAAKFGFVKADYWKVRLLLKSYCWLNQFVATLFILFPSLLDRWLRYQFGTTGSCVTVNKLFPEPAPVRQV